MKRKKRVSLKRCVVRERLCDMVFTLEYLKEGSQKRCVLSPAFFGDTRYPTDDIAHCGLFLDPPLSWAQLEGSTLDVYYAGKDPIGRGRVQLVLFSSDSRAEDVALEDKFVYRLFKTHSLRMTLTQKEVSCVEFTLHNTQLMAMDNTPLLDIVHDIGPWFAEHFQGRFVEQPYYPADPAVMQALSSVSSQDVPQRTPYWFMLRGLVTGSKAYKYCGFFQNQSGFDAAALKRMRMGRLAEDFACGNYLLNTPPHIKIHAVGLVPYAERPGWGASPDGLIVDEKMTWDDVPEYTRSAYNDKRIDITRGALEIKCSQANCLMRDYYYPQVYLEMMALGVVWADVVRYSETRGTNGSGVWSTKRECRVYRIYRHKPTEDRIVDCIITALNTNTSNKQPLYNTRAFVSLRNYLKDLASRASYKKIPVSEELHQSYMLYFVLPPLPSIEHSADKKTKTTTLANDIEERQLEIFRLYEREDKNKTSREFVSHIISQIKDLLQMLEEKTNL